MLSLWSNPVLIDIFPGTKKRKKERKKRKRELARETLLQGKNERLLNFITPS